ncbi:tetratricopeptide repeat protein [Bailinhaonella thermotolerans]|uniref:Tetratricopeptide repeat protein n=1 Tax=Bailinhaonella thermotolerans TaxID=1070861 RepID=A0A3A4AWJ7_9ACTN|nr:tetratricopeptide repeat protein [Bailinhaonella thermotolerans]RJL32667.1 hypothetical protein D5H75_14295 [Bailinhaonella thermotolerans]
MTAPDPIMERIGAATALGHRGDRDGARRLLGELWDELTDPLHRCALAHAMADLQDDPREELTWDLRALEAADSITDERARRAGATGQVAAFYPSLHLNLGDVLHRLGDLGRARDHLRRGLAAADALPDDGYGRMIRQGLANLADRLGTA